MGFSSPDFVWEENGFGRVAMRGAVSPLAGPIVVNRFKPRDFDNIDAFRYARVRDQFEGGFDLDNLVNVRGEDAQSISCSFCFGIPRTRPCVLDGCLAHMVCEWCAESAISHGRGKYVKYIIYILIYLNVDFINFSILIII